MYLTNINKSLRLIPMLSNTLMSSMMRQNGRPPEEEEEAAAVCLISSYNSFNDLQRIFFLGWIVVFLQPFNIARWVCSVGTGTGGLRLGLRFRIRNLRISLHRPFAVESCVVWGDFNETEMIAGLQVDTLRWQETGSQPRWTCDFWLTSLVAIDE